MIERLGPDSTGERWEYGELHCVLMDVIVSSERGSEKRRRLIAWLSWHGGEAAAAVQSEVEALNRAGAGGWIVWSTRTANSVALPTLVMNEASTDANDIPDKFGAVTTYCVRRTINEAANSTDAS